MSWRKVVAVYFLSIILSDANEETPGSGNGTLWNNSLLTIGIYGFGSGIRKKRDIEFWALRRNYPWFSGTGQDESLTQFKALHLVDNVGLVESSQKFPPQKSFSGLCDGPVALVSWKSEVSLQGVSATSLPTTLCSSKYLWFSRTTDTIYSPAFQHENSIYLKRKLLGPGLVTNLLSVGQTPRFTKIGSFQQGVPPQRSTSSWPIIFFSHLQPLFRRPRYVTSSTFLRSRVATQGNQQQWNHTIDFDLLSYRFPGTVTLLNPS